MKVHRDMDEQLQGAFIHFKILAQNLTSPPILGGVLLSELVGGKASQSQIPLPFLCLYLPNPHQQLIQMTGGGRHSLESTSKSGRSPWQCEVSNRAYQPLLRYVPG